MTDRRTDCATQPESMRETLDLIRTTLFAESVKHVELSIGTKTSRS